MSAITQPGTVKPVCLEGGTKHAWEKLGLDIVKGELRSVKRCVWCKTERTSKPTLR